MFRPGSPPEIAPGCVRPKPDFSNCNTGDQFSECDLPDANTCGGDGLLPAKRLFVLNIEHGKAETEDVSEKKLVY